jgi:hypothetical protein
MVMFRISIPIHRGVVKRQEQEGSCAPRGLMALSRLIVLANFETSKRRFWIPFFFVTPSEFHSIFGEILGYAIFYQRKRKIISESRSWSHWEYMRSGNVGRVIDSVLTQIILMCNMWQMDVQHGKRVPSWIG